MRHPIHRPLWLALTMFAAGIITGEVSGVSCVLHETGARIALWATPVLLALTTMVPTIRQRHATTATAMLLTAVFATGILRTDTGGSGTEKRAEQTGTMEYVARHADTQRAKLKGIYKEIGLRGDEYAIVVAMTLGEKEDTSQRLKEAYRNSGAAHIFALSGMHMSILFFFLCCIIPYRKHPPISAVVLTAGIWAYVMLVGTHPSVVRAATMLSIYILLTAAGRRNGNRTVLPATAFLILIVKPEWLFDVGFEMSFAAVTGIATFYQPLYKILDFRPYRSKRPWFMQRRHRKIRYMALLEELVHNTIIRIGAWIWGLTVLSITAQTAVAPLIAWYFGSVSPMFLLSGYVVSPCALLIIPLAIVAVALYGAVTLLPWLTPLLSLCVWALSTVAGIQNAAILKIAAIGT